MPDEDNQIDAAMRQLSKQVDKGAEKLHQITPAQLEAVHSEVRRRRLGAEQSAKQPTRISDFLLLLRQPIVWIPASAVLMFALWFVMSGPRNPTETLFCKAEFRGPNVEEGPLSGPLALELRFGSQHKTLTLVAGAARYTGEMSGGTNSEPTQQVFDVAISGKSAKGEGIELKGQLYLNLNTPTSTLPTRTQISNARLEGDLKVGGQIRPPVNKIFEKP